MGYDGAVQASMQATEILGFITGVICVLLAVRENIWNWPVGIANNIFYLVVFWHAKLYADSCLQLFYMAVSIYGLWAWRYGGKRHTELSVGRVSTKTVPLLVIVTVIAAAVLRFVLHSYTDSTVPFWDGMTTAMSLVAQYMLGRKWLENWWLWMAVDVIYVGLYVYKHLYLTAVLYAVFFGLCVAGWLRWQKLLSGATAGRAVEASG
jgi:nicotinamide mononucleotide transporter